MKTQNNFAKISLTNCISLIKEVLGLETSKGKVSIIFQNETTLIFRWREIIDDREDYWDKEFFLNQRGIFSCDMKCRESERSELTNSRVFNSFDQVTLEKFLKYFSELKFPKSFFEDLKNGEIFQKDKSCKIFPSDFDQGKNEIAGRKIIGPLVRSFPENLFPQMRDLDYKTGVFGKDQLRIEIPSGIPDLSSYAESPDIV